MPLIHPSKTETKKRLHGLFIINSIKKQPVGMNRSLINAAPFLKNLDFVTHYFVPSSIYRFAESIFRCLVYYRKFSFDFALYNGAASLFNGSPLGIITGGFLLKRNVPIFIYWHESDMAFHRMKFHSKSKLKLLDNFVLNNTQITHLCASEHSSKSIQKRYSHTSPLVVYENSVVPKPFNHTRTPSVPPLVVNLASIQKRKGTDLFVETAIKVCQRHPTVEFIWAGKGDSYGQWQSEIKKAKLEKRIFFPGYIDSAYLLLRESSIFFMSSRDDPMPLSVIEAMCLGKTIVTFDTGGTPEVLGDQCYIVPCYDTDVAAKFILDCLNKKPTDLINEKVRELYFKNFTPQRFADKLNLTIRNKLES